MFSQLSQQSLSASKFATENTEMFRITDETSYISIQEILKSKLCIKEQQTFIHTKLSVSFGLVRQRRVPCALRAARRVCITRCVLRVVCCALRITGCVLRASYCIFIALQPAEVFCPDAGFSQIVEIVFSDRLEFFQIVFRSFSQIVLSLFLRSFRSFSRSF